MNNSGVPSDCPSLDRSAFIAETVVFLLVAIVATLEHGLLAVILWKTKVFHPHVRVCLLQINAGSLIYVLYFFCHTGYHIALLSAYDPVSDDAAVVHLHPTPRTCVLFQCVFFFGGLLPMTATPLLVLDRLISSWRREFANPENSSRMFKCLIAVSLVISAMLALESLATIFTHTDPVCYCSLDFVNSPEVSLASMSCVFTVNISSVLGFLLIYHWNRQYATLSNPNIRRLTLSERFQVWSNLESLKFLIPSTVLQGVMSSCAIFLYTWQLRQTAQGSVVTAARIHVSLLEFLPSASFSLLFPFFCLKFHRRLRTNASALIRQILPCYGVKVRPIEKGGDEYQQAPVATVIPYTVTPDKSQALLETFWNVKRQQAV